MYQGKKAMKILVILVLLLTLTAGYAQALPDLSSFGYRSASTASLYDLIASKLPGIFGKSPVWDIPSNGDLPPFNYISKSEAISIAKDYCNIDISLQTTAKLQWIYSLNDPDAPIWEVTIKGRQKNGAGLSRLITCVVKIDGYTGSIISVN